MAEYKPQVWRVNVREQTLEREPVPDSWKRLGGRGLLARILLDEVDAKCDPLGPGNKLVFAPGLLVGHMLSSTDRISVGAKSPLTGGVKESNAGGRTGLHMTHMGIHALIIEDQPKENGSWILHLSLNGTVWERADDLIGLGVYETAPRLLQKYGDKVAVALIGPGGEMQMKAAGIQNLDKDRVPSRIAARGGLLIANNRNGSSQFLEWLEPARELSRVAPSFILAREHAWAAITTTVVWIAVLAVAAALLRRMRSLSGGGAAAATVLTGAAVLTIGAALATIAEQEAGVESLRDVDPEMLARHAPRLAPVELARAEHVVRENLRVLRTVEALESGNVDAIGRLFAESHASLRDRFEVSSPELDAMVDIAAATPGVVAARMTGAGFGGCTVNLVRPDAVEAFRATIEREYPERTGREPRLFVVTAADGAGVMAPDGVDG